MREILFRGKLADQDEWVDGSLVLDGEDTMIFTVRGFPEGTGMFSVDPATVGQYTGLTDKNGKKIFEGDIVDILTENEEIGLVAYDDGGFLVEADGFSVDFHANINGTDLEIIGNIHDNPELLEAADG